MAIPSRWDLTLPILEMLEHGELDHSEIADKLAEQFNLTEAERNKRSATGKRKFRETEVGFAKQQLKEAGLIDYGNGKRRPARITERGRQILSLRPENIDKGFLKSLE